MSMKENRIWFTAAAFVSILAIGLGWLIGIAPVLATSSAARQNLSNVEIQNRLNGLLLERLRRDYEGIDELRVKRASLRESVPDSSKISTFVKELNLLAGSTQVLVKTIVVNDAKPYTPISVGMESDGKAGEGSSLTNPQITTANFIVLPIQFSLIGRYSKVLNFIQQVQNGQRLFLISNLTSHKSTGPGNASAVPSKADANTTGRASEIVEATVGGFIYVLIASGKR